MTENNAANAEQDELVITRNFDAPRALVFKAFTEPEHLKNWWGPKGSAITVAKFDLRPGGEFLYSMRHGDGREMWGKFVYREIVQPEKVVYVNFFSDAEGNLAPNPFQIPHWPQEILNTWTFDENDGKTTLTLRGGPINATSEERNTFNGMRGSMQEGFGGTFDQLDEYLAQAF
ncbi:SRPBCC domain-containing protein [Cohnella nanjingensis]|uniref:SRPBCC domain-containing protein n=1 Tax=Cohnella nanjingensis TaxID=1387779 RepID=A0A7X0VDB8_9BACL|nr:SRPBCC domain-containing protein [Cohnella nanjingensis]MBB6669536.1 SRPBCC domain-containing protein [Cohnella nanjingensis]